MLESKKKYYTRIIAIIMVSALLLASGCKDSKSGTPTESEKATNAVETTASPEHTATPSEKASEPIGGESGNERIGFITQEYNGDNIVEIPYIEYDGEMNPEIEAINRSFNQGYQFRYEEFLSSKAEHEWIEIRSYPFTTDDYLQIVTTNCIYPTYGTDGDLASVNYDRKAKKWLSVNDALDMLGLDEDKVSVGVRENFMPETSGETIDTVKIAGFLISDTMIGKMPILLLNITVDNPGAEPWQGFYSYLPDGNGNTNDLTRLGSQCLFDPYDMDQMNPPLSYQRNLPADNHVQGDPGDTGMVQWWGIYAKDDDSGFVMEVYEVGEKDFQAYIIQLREPHDMNYVSGLTSLRDIGNAVDHNVVKSGKAIIEADNPYFAMLDDIGLELSGDYSNIILYATESGEWQYMRGQYTKLG